jgi:hypothetical protein
MIVDGFANLFMCNKGHAIFQELNNPDLRVNASWSSNPTQNLCPRQKHSSFMLRKRFFVI